jgi:hypothetical protein
VSSRPVRLLQTLEQATAESGQVNRVLPGSVWNVASAEVSVLATFQVSDSAAACLAERGATRTDGSVTAHWRSVSD